jgi:hypothetical protein
VRVGESRRARGEAGRGFDIARSGRRADLLVPRGGDKAAWWIVDGSLRSEMD